MMYALRAALCCTLLLVAACSSPDPRVVTRSQVIVCPAVLPPEPDCGAIPLRGETLRDLLGGFEAATLVAVCFSQDAHVVRETVRLCREAVAADE